MRTNSAIRWLPLLAAACLPAVTLTQCKRQETPEAGANSSESAKPKVPFADQADQVGGIVLLPADTEFYVGSAQFAKHYAAAKATRWWKDLTSLIDDKNPASDIKNENLRALTELWGGDFFVAGGQGFADTLLLAKEFNRLYNELSFKILMTGAPNRLQGKPDFGPNPAEILKPFLSDPALAERIVAILKQVDVSPILIGIKTTDAQAKLDKIITDKEIAKLEEKKIKVVDHQTSEGFKFKAATIDLANVFEEEKAKQFLEKLPPNLPADIKAQIEDLVKSVRAKKMQAAWGVVNDYVIFSAGKNLDHLKFAKDPTESLLTNPAFAKLKEHEGKNLSALLYVKKEALSALHDDQPFIPMLKGAVSAMQENAVFASAGGVLSKQLEELTPLEVAAFGRKMEDGAALLWWDMGLKGESVGGVDPRFFENGKPLKYAELLEGKKVLFGITFHSDPAYSKDVRNWMEKLAGMFYVGAKELVKAGIAGSQGQQQLAFFDMFLLPTIQKVYQAEKDLHEKGLGNEMAIVLDLEGKEDRLPGVLEDGMPRLFTVSEIKDRFEVANSWKTISDTLIGILAMVGANTGGESPGSLISEPVKTDNNGFTTWEYKAPVFSGDFSPNSTLNDQHLILSSSKIAALDVASKLSNPSATTPIVEGCIWKFDMEILTQVLSVITKVAPKNAATQDLPEPQQFLEFLKPFKTMKGHSFVKDGDWRSTFEWEIVEPVSFD